MKLDSTDLRILAALQADGALSNVELLPGVFSLDGSKEFGVGLFDKNIAVVHGVGSPMNLCPLKQGLPRRTAERKVLGPCGTLPSGSQEAGSCWFPRQRQHP